MSRCLLNTQFSRDRRAPQNRYAGRRRRCLREDSQPELLSHFEFAAVPQVGADAAGAEAMGADLDSDAGRECAMVDHAVARWPVQRNMRHHQFTELHAGEEGSAGLAGQAGRTQPLI